MQFLRSKQHFTTCLQCDNIVRSDSDVCNICGQRLKPQTKKGQAEGFPTTPLPQSAFTTVAAPTPPPSTRSRGTTTLTHDRSDETKTSRSRDRNFPFLAESNLETTLPMPANLEEITTITTHLLTLSDSIHTYFPSHFSEKDQKFVLWLKHIQRVQACIRLLQHPQIQQIDAQQGLKLRYHLAEATQALDFTREYAVKIVGHAGAGKSTLLAALIGQDIFPRLAGGAVTGVCTRIRFCSSQEPEELRVHFMTRAEFNQVLKQIQQSLHNTTHPHVQEALATEMMILQKAYEAFGEHYLYDQQPKVETIAREHWKTEGSRYIEEPARDNEQPRLIRLIKYVEYTIRMHKDSLLPPGSVLVDLPGGTAGQLRHDAILHEELNDADAILLVMGNNRFGDDDRTQRIFELVKQKVVQRQDPETAAQMIFLVVTHWDEINSAASQEKALGSLRPLLHNLPAHYQQYHHHSGSNDYFFYPIRGLDALLATLGTGKQVLDADRVQEGREYAGRILSVYPELVKIDATLPGTAHAQDFQKVTQKQHAAMLHYSGLPELKTDLQTFLTRQRYDMQLRKAEMHLAHMLQQLEDICWEQINHSSMHSRDLQELQQEQQARQSKRSATRFKQINERTQGMIVAWCQALKEFSEAMSAEHNPFYQALEVAHKRSIQRITLRITHGHFDHFIKVHHHRNLESPAMEIGTRWIDVDGWGLVRELRSHLCAAIERELNEPARTLAETFLIPVSHKEEIEETLDIYRVALGESGGEIDELQKSYQKLKRTIRDRARDICLDVTIGELLNEEKYAPTKEDPAISALYRLASTIDPPENLIEQARQLMVPILDLICEQLAHSTERRIIHLFRYELDKLEAHLVYDSNRLDTAPTTISGPFADLVHRLYSLLTERVITSEALRQQLDTLQTSKDLMTDRWIELLSETEVLRTAHRQNS